MPRSDEDPVIRDSRCTLWAAVRDNVVHSADLSPDGKLRPSLTPSLAPTPEATVTRDWSTETARIRAGLPFARQRDPTMPPPVLLPPVVRRPLQPVSNVHINILRDELRIEEDTRRASEKRERALIKMVEGLCEWKRACD